MPSSRLKAEIARILKDEGYISNFKVVDEEKKKVLRVLLRYDADGQSAVSSLERISKPGRRVYVGAHGVPRVLGGLGVTILTTPKGVMTGKSARKAGVGGEVLCSVS
jgi:small subunit ribosomal protein S8